VARAPVAMATAWETPLGRQQPELEERTRALGAVLDPRYSLAGRTVREAAAAVVTLAAVERRAVAATREAAATPAVGVQSAAAAPRGTLATPAAAAA